MRLVPGSLPWLLCWPLCWGLLGVGCDDRALTEEDCSEVRRRLEEAWTRDAVSAARLVEKDQLLPFIRDEGKRLGDSWMKRCRQRVGSPVSADELACLDEVETIDDVYECGR